MNFRTLHAGSMMQLSVWAKKLAAAHVDVAIHRTTASVKAPRPTHQRAEFTASVQRVFLQIIPNNENPVEIVAPTGSGCEDTEITVSMRISAPAAAAKGVTVVTTCPDNVEITKVLTFQGVLVGPTTSGDTMSHDTLRHVRQ